MKELRGTVAVITGAAGGIGAALARALHREGARVVLVDLARAPLEDAARSLGEGAIARPMDVSDGEAWDALAAEVHEQGGADLLINNAGITILGAFADQSRADVDRIVDVNLKGVLHGCRAFLPQLAARRGHVVNVSSLAGRVAFPYQSTYCATKFAVRGFTASLRMELAGRVGVTAVLPGTVATRLLQAAHSYDATASGKMAELMLAHGVRPEHVADRVLQAIRRDEAEVLIGWDARLTTAAQSLTPALLTGALAAGFRWRARP